MRVRSRADITWLAVGVCYALAYVTVGFLLHDSFGPLLWFRTIALVVPPLVAVLSIVRGRQLWVGCHWLFWATIVLGLVITAVGFVGWTLDEILISRETSWMRWPTVFWLFGSAAPLFALLAQPHRGPRESAAATTAVDIAGVAVLAGYLYTYVVSESEVGAAAIDSHSISLVFLSELQQLVVLAGLMAAVAVTARSPWHTAYRRLTLGAVVGFLMLSLSNAGIWLGAYRSVFVYDFALIVPFFFYPWAAAAAPASASDPGMGAQLDAPRRPWVIFGVLALMPLVDYGMRAVFPVDPSVARLRDISMAVTVMSILPLLMARLAVERAELRRADSEARRLAATAEQVGDLYRALVDNAPLGIFRATLDGCLLTVNPALVRMLGATSAESLLGTRVERLFKSANDGAARLEEWRRAEWIDATEVEWQSADGRDVVAHLSGRLVHDRAISERVFEVFVEDVTGRRALEGEFRQAQKMEAVGRLAGGVAHDFNNQLTVILGYTEVLLAGAGSNDALRHDLREIQRAGQHASALTRRLLAFSRRQVMQLVPLDVNDVLRRTHHLLERLLGEDIRIETHLSADLPLFRADAVQLEQVIMNLAINARDAMPHGGRFVVETSRVDLRETHRKPGRVLVRPGRYVMLAATDTGVGMDVATQGRIFEPFFTTKGHGTGLGLSTVYGIVKQLGGYVWVYSEPNVGTTFKLYFPVSFQSAQPAGAEAVPEGLAEGSETILLVEDEDAVREFSASLLKRHGYRVLAASSAEEALAIAERADAIDLVLTDVIMPGLSGPEMVARLMSARRVRSLFMSGYTERVLRDGVLTRQAPLIEKPFGPEELLRRVRQTLDTNESGWADSRVGHA